MEYAQKNKFATTAAALTAWLAFSAVAPSMAQDVNSNENFQQTTLQQASMLTITAEEAKELSKPQYEDGPGKVVLLVGDDFNQRYLNSIIERLEEVEVNVEVYTGGELSRHLQLFIAGGEIPEFIEENIARHKLVSLVNVIVEQNNLDVYAED